MLKTRFFILILALLTAMPAPTLSSEVESSLNPGVQEFLTSMKSEKLYSKSHPQTFNHYYRSPVNHPTAVVFLPGMGEAAIKYYEIPSDLKKIPATIYMWDHLGQGFSSNYLPDEPHKIFIDSFDSHVAALENFLAEVRKNHKNVYVVAHSMGAHVALRVADAHPDFVDKLVLSAPLIDLNLPWIPIRVLNWFFKLMPGSYYPPLYGWFKKGAASDTYVTHSIARQKIYRQTCAVYPEIRRDGATVGWISAAMASIEAMKKENFSAITAPILMLQAETDDLVSNKAQDQFCQRLPTCRPQIIAGSKHEILFERDDIRTPAVNQIISFLNSKSAVGSRKLKGLGQ